MNDDALKNFDEAVAQWEKEDPGVSDIETPPHGSTEHETVLPGLDLSEGQQPQEPVPSETKAEPPSEPWARVKFEMDQQKSTKPSSSDLESKMQSVGWTPKERSGPPDYEKLLSDIQNAERSANATRIGQQSFQAVAPSFHADSNAGSVEIAAAKAPLEVEQQRQAMEAKQQAADEERLMAGKKARLDDPSSAESRRAQARIQGLFPDSRRIPSGLSGMSANEIERLTPTLTSLSEHDLSADASKLRETEAEKAKAAAAAQHETERSENNKYRDQAHSDSQTNAAATRSLAAAGLNIRQNEEAEKDKERTARQAPIAAGHIQFSPTGTIDEATRKKGQEIASGFGGTFSSMDGLEKALGDYAAHPSADTVRNVESQVQVVATGLNTALGQGAMSEAEARNIKAALGADLFSAAGAQALAKSLTGDPTGGAKILTTRLHAARQAAEAAAVGKMKSYGYEPQTGGKTTPSGKPYAKSQTNSDGTKRRFLDASGGVIEEVLLK